MALLKDIESPQGTQAKYWKIISSSITTPAAGQKIMHVEMGGWLNKAARNNGKAPLALRVYDWTNGDCPDQNGNLRQLAYEKIKTDTEFVGSTDDNNE